MSNGSFELLFRDLSSHGPTLSNESQDRLKTQLKHISYSYIYSYDFSKQKGILNKEEWSAVNDLRKDDSIIITRPDKGNGIVIVNKLDYLHKMKQLISDETKFKKLTQNPTKSREDTACYHIYVNSEKMESLMMPPFRRYFHLVLLLVSSTVFPRFTSLVTLFVLLFPLSTLTTTILHLILYAFFNLSPPTSSE